MTTTDGSRDGWDEGGERELTHAESVGGGGGEEGCSLTILYSQASNSDESIKSI